MPRRPRRYTMQDLEREAGVPARTIRYYVVLGLISAPRGRGPHATYDRTDLLRLRLVQQLKGSLLSLDDIKRHLSGLDETDIAAALGEPEEEEEEEPDEPPAGEAWTHHAPHPDVAVLVRDNPGHSDRFREGVTALLRQAEQLSE